MRFNLSIPLTVAILGAATPGLATVYYVDYDNGSNTNSGTSPGTGTSGPWKDLDKVNGKVFSAGDVVLFKRGQTWNEKLTVNYSGNASRFITFGAYNFGARPIIDVGSSRDSAVYLSGGSYVRFQELDLRGGTQSAFHAVGTTSNLEFSNVLASGASKAGFEFDSATNVMMMNSKAYDNRGSGDTGFGFQFKAHSGNITLSHCKAFRNKHSGVQVDRDVTGYIDIIGGEYYNNYGTDSSDGITIASNDEILIHGVSAHHNGYEPGPSPTPSNYPGSSADGIQVVDEIYDTVNGPVDDYPIVPTIQWCTLYDNRNSGMQLQTAGGNINHNVIYENDKHGIALNKNGENRPLNIAHNTFYNNNRGIFMYQDENGGDKKYVRIMNNILYGSGGTEDTANERRAIYRDITASSSNSMYALISEQNCFWGDSDQAMIKWLSNPFYNRTPAGFSSYQSTSGANQDKTSILKAPGFVNASQHQLWIEGSSSACYGMGYLSNRP